MPDLKTRVAWAILVLMMLASGQAPALLSQSKYRTDSDIKKTLLEKYRIQPEWQEMEIVRIFPGEEDLKSSHYLNYPSDLVRIGDNLFVGDYGLGQVLIFDKDGTYRGTFGRRGQGPGEFSRLGEIAGNEASGIYVTDSGRIQHFSLDGSFLESFKFFDIVNDMVINGPHLLINAIYGQSKNKQNPLIIRCDLAGNIISTFGNRIDQDNHYSTDSRAYLAARGSETVAVFRHYPQIQIYDHLGVLKKQSQISIPILTHLEKFNYDSSFTNPMPGVINLTRLVAGVQIARDKIFILLHLPRIEIHEIDESGKVQKVYYSQRLNNIVDYRGFALRPDGPDYFAYIVTVSEEEISLYTFKIKQTR
ncbi:MAG TPA: 6-bladed beta-propeller [Candidatus Saccharicenans sp.]|jgi:hypothetical protein|nr:6-bladed beta-propeller [Candidatus Saccharicenans sp.]HRD02299.1 6-bladed beta-propeller [Candidatus Saccharicenans sp.]